MTTEELKTLVASRFQAMGLLDCVDLQDSTFGELPRFFEVSHLTMEVAVLDPSMVPQACRIVDQIKSDLFVRYGVELDAVTRSKALVGQ